MTCDQIHVRDPYVLRVGETYYLYGSRGDECWGACTGLDVYTSRDLVHWSAPQVCFVPPAGFWSDREYWAPEVHVYCGRYYMCVTFGAAGRFRGTQILKADSPLGPFVPHSDGPVTPADWSSLDGTLYVARDGTPYLVFCHEWTQIGDGEVCAMPLTHDLRAPAGKPFTLFAASSCAAVRGAGEGTQYVTDGPFLHRTADGTLLMIWSSFVDGGYCEIVSVSDNGDIDGVWSHRPDLLFAQNGGHGMLFTDTCGVLRFVMHAPNTAPDEHPVIFSVREAGGTLVLE